jgi:hypothetical protein
MRYLRKAIVLSALLFTLGLGSVAVSSTSQPNTPAVGEDAECTTCCEQARASCVGAGYDKPDSYDNGTGPCPAASEPIREGA